MTGHDNEIVSLGLGPFGSLCFSQWFNLIHADCLLHSADGGGGVKFPRILFSEHNGNVWRSRGIVVSEFTRESLLPTTPPPEITDNQHDEGNPSNPQEKEQSSELSSRRTFPQPRWWEYITAPFVPSEQVVSFPIESFQSAHTFTAGEPGGDLYQSLWTSPNPFGPGLRPGFSGDSLLDTLLDTQLRLQLEQCDSPQGVQCFVDADGPFGGLARTVLNIVRDEYHVMPIVYPILAPQQQLFSDTATNTIETRLQSSRRRRQTFLNRALMISRFCESSSICIPFDLTEWPGQPKSLNKTRIFWPLDALSLLDEPAIAELITLGIHSSFRSVFLNDFEPFAQTFSASVPLRNFRDVVMTLPPRNPLAHVSLDVQSFAPETNSFKENSHPSCKDQFQQSLDEYFYPIEDPLHVISHIPLHSRYPERKGFELSFCSDGPKDARPFHWILNWNMNISGLDSRIPAQQLLSSDAPGCLQVYPRPMPLLLPASRLTSLPIPDTDRTVNIVSKRSSGMERSFQKRVCREAQVSLQKLGVAGSDFGLESDEWDSILESLTNDKEY